MPQTIKLKRSATAGQVPTTGQLALGELGINTADGKVFLRKNNGTTDVIMEISGSIAGTATTITSGTTAPTDPAPKDGDLWYDTANDTLMVYNGTSWEAVAGDNAQSFMTTAATAPTTRPDGSALVTGDTYYDTADGQLMIWNGTAWVSSKAGVESVRSDAAAPTTQIDGTALAAGDTYYNTTDENLYIHDGTAWRLNSWYNLIEPKAAAPTTRDNGEALQAGDIYWDTGDSELFVYSGTQWSQVVTDVSAPSPHLGSSSTVLTQRPNGQALVVGDIYWNTADSEMKVYTGIAGNLWSPLGGASGGSTLEISDTTPTTTVDGSLWYDTGTTGHLMVYSQTAQAWIDLSAAGEQTLVSLSDTAPANPNEGDLWYDTGTNGHLHAYSETAQAWIDLYSVPAASVSNFLPPNTTDPTTRAGGGSLLEGDIYYNTTDDAIKSYDGAAWNAVGGVDLSGGLGAAGSSTVPIGGLVLGFQGRSGASDWTEVYQYGQNVTCTGGTGGADIYLEAYLSTSAATDNITYGTWKYLGENRVDGILVVRIS